MITRRQVIFIGVWVGFPFVLFLVLFVINPAYEARLFQRFGPVYGISLLTLLEVLHGLVLYVGFRMSNRALDRSDEQRPRRNRLILLLAIVTMFVCSFPSLWLVLFYPSMMTLLEPRNLP